MNISVSERAQYLEADFFADWQHPEIKRFAISAAAGATSAKKVAVNLYYTIRDKFYYNPFELYFTKEHYQASNFLHRPSGNCIDKANLYIACARLHGIPSRYRFANVCNHVGSEKMNAILQSNVIVFHGMAEIFLNNHWVKVAPAFNKELCQKLSVAPLEFDGTSDAIFQENNQHGKRFMEYLYDHGYFKTFPYELFIKTFFEQYPHLDKGSDSLKYQTDKL